MENNEEKKVGCCEGKGHCEHGMMNCCHNWKKCHMIRKIVWLVILIVIFCLGAQWGEMKSERRGDYRFNQRGMMNFGYGKFNDNTQKATGEVTVEVKKAAEVPTSATPTTPTPAPKQ